MQYHQLASDHRLAPLPTASAARSLYAKRERNTPKLHQIPCLAPHQSACSRSRSHVNCAATTTAPRKQRTHSPSTTLTRSPRRPEPTTSALKYCSTVASSQVPSRFRCSRAIRNNAASRPPRPRQRPGPNQTPRPHPPDIHYLLSGLVALHSVRPCAPVP